MTNPQQFYLPRDPDVLDNIGYTQRVVDSILRNNPLTDAVVGHGLIKWIGNYTNAGNPDKINFLWIGEFQPADVNLPGNPPQRGFSLVRDDSRGGRSAISMFDGSPNAGGGLRQVLTFSSGDGQPIMRESRNGGIVWPEENVWMGGIDSDILKWTGTDAGSFSAIFEGHASVVGNRVAYRVFAATSGGGQAEFRLRVLGFDGDHTGPTHVLTGAGPVVFDDSVDVTTLRGSTPTIYWEARRTNGVGKVHSIILTVRIFTP